MRVLTNEGQAVADEAVSIRAPGERGSVGFLYNHAPLVTTLATGTLTWRRADGVRRTFSIGGGLLEITHNRCTVLTARVAEATPQPKGAAHT